MELSKIPQISRRSFLKASVGAAALSGLALPNTAHAREEDQLATLIDLSLCDGCSDREMPACVSTCKALNKDKIPKIAEPIPVPWPRKIIEDWSKKKDVVNRLTSLILFISIKPIWNGRGRRRPYSSRDAACIAIIRPVRQSVHSRRIINNQTVRWSSIRICASAAPNARQSAPGKSRSGSPASASTFMFCRPSWETASCTSATSATIVFARGNCRDVLRHAPGRPCSSARKRRWMPLLRNGRSR